MRMLMCGDATKRMHFGLSEMLGALSGGDLHCMTNSDFPEQSNGRYETWRAQRARQFMTPLTKPLKRQVNIQGRPFVVTLSPGGIAVTLKGKRKGQELRWEDLVSGDAALATALSASLSRIPQADEPRQRRQAKSRTGRKRPGAVRA